MGYFFWNCRSVGSHIPQCISLYCHYSWLFSRIWWWDPTTEITASLSRGTRRHLAGTAWKLSPLTSFHSFGSCYACHWRKSNHQSYATMTPVNHNNSWPRRVGSLVQQWTNTCRSNNHFLSGFRAHGTRQNSCLALLPGPMARHVIGPEGESATTSLLNGHSIKLCKSIRYCRVQPK